MADFFFIPSPLLYAHCIFWGVGAEVREFRVSPENPGFGVKMITSVIRPEPRSYFWCLVISRFALEKLCTIWLNVFRVYDIKLIIFGFC